MSLLRANVFLVVLAGALVPGLASAGDGDRIDPIAGARRLRAARSVQPLADTGSGITRDVGDIAVIEHDGSSYDWKEPDGTPNYAARARVAQRFYQDHPDQYDFLVVFTNFEFVTGEATAFHNLVRNDVRGTHKPITDSGTFFGSPGRLKGYVDMATLARYANAPYSLDPGRPGFAATLNVLAHEIGHQWLAEVRYRDASGGDSAALLGADGAHWSYLLDSDASVLYGADWAASGGGRYTAARVQDTYSSLDLYLMGLLDPAKVQPFTLLRNPAVDATGIPVEGATLAATPETVTLGQVVGAEGARSPDYRASQKELRVGFVFLTRPGTEPTGDDLQAADRIRDAFAGHFFALTRGLAVAETTLTAAPPQTPAPAPDLDRALAWLLAQQSIDGRWEDASTTGIRDTGAALEALAAAGENGAASYQRGIAWMRSADVANVDYAARRATALASGPDRAALAAALLAQQNADGGFGAARGYESDPLDTALALRALSTLGRTADTSVRRALATLGPMRTMGGGWPVVPGGEPSTIATAQVLLALGDWSATPEAQALIAPGLAALLARRNLDGGFGESPSTPYATALALQALLRSGASGVAVDGAVAWLQGAQLSDGSWDESRFETALVLGALKNGVAPNLTVPADSLVFDPASPQEGATVRVNARVRNTGRAAAGASLARLYDGDPSLAVVVGEAAVPALTPGGEAAVFFDYPTTDRAGSHTLYVMADAGSAVAESREDDNAASRALQVTGLLPDLVIAPGGVSVAPYPPEEGETVQVAVTVRNLGPRQSPPSQLLVARDGSVMLGQVTAPALGPGQAVTLMVPWDTTGALGPHDLLATADGVYAVAESNEANNQASLHVDVRAPQTGGVDLELASLTLTPASLSTIPQTITAQAVVRNLGKDPVTSTVVLRDGPPPAGALLGQQSVDLGQRSVTTLTFSATIGAGGDHTIVAVADPAGSVSETDESNNAAQAVLADPHNTVDLEIRPEDVVASTTDATLGQKITVTAQVRNRGTAPVTGVPVALIQSDSGGFAELARADVTLGPGAAASVALDWVASVTGAPVPLAVRADPYGSLTELSEENNAVGVPVRIRASDLPDLAVRDADVGLEPNPPLEGGSATLSAAVRNPSGVAAGPFVVRFARREPAGAVVTIADVPVDGLAGLGSREVTVQWSPVEARSAQGVVVTVDPLGQVAEYDESDNEANRAFNVAGYADLVLATSDLTLDPPFPHAGETTVVRATVRNLGARVAGESALRAFDGDAGTGAVVADLPIPALAPGASAALQFSWSPGAPGEWRLSLLADADDVVREQDEGNNLARRMVVVQDADLYLSAPYFSPNGDGAQDETTLAYRVGGVERVLVKDGYGRTVRAFAEAASSGAVTWDGRQDDGPIAFDGAYTFFLEGQDGVELGRATVVLDTNRSPLHDAAGTGLTRIDNMTCAVPVMLGAAWIPGTKEALFINYQNFSGFPAGLMRVSRDGGYEYVSRDPWYWNGCGGLPYGSNGLFMGIDGVSPDGREALIRKHPYDSSCGPWAPTDLYAVDLATGLRRLMASNVSFDSKWSPDGRWVVTQDQVVDRDGTPVVRLWEFPSSGASNVPEWSWSPDGGSLAWGNTIVRRDGTDKRWIRLPPQFPASPEGQLDELLTGVRDTFWRGDGKIVTTVGCRDCDPSVPETHFLLDPETGTATEISEPLTDAWSPDGRKMLYPTYDPPPATLWVRENGASSALAQLPPGNRYFEGGIGSRGSRSPDGSAAWLKEFRPLSCPGPKYPAYWDQFNEDYLALTSLQNLVAEFTVARLPANDGLQVTGTVSDRNLDHFQLEYASASDRETWHPIGPSSEVPVIRDTITTWVPPAPGSYVLRLRIYDRAGNSGTASQVVFWDRLATLNSVSQTETLISPNGDGVKDVATFHYAVGAPVEIDVRVTGPQSGDGTPAPAVWQLHLSYAQPGAFSFTWEGRDVPDGRYTVLVNDLSFHVDVDTTPPDIAWSYSSLRAERGSLVADRLWHVVDPHLKDWSSPVQRSGVGQVYEPERDASGAIVYDDGVPRIARNGDRAADRRDVEYSAAHVASDPSSFTAEDYAGNRSTVSIAPVEERLVLLGASVEQRLAGVPKPFFEAAFEAPVSPDRVYALKAKTFFRLAETIRGTPASGETVRFQYRRADDAGWSEAAAFQGRTGFGWAADLAALGVTLGQEYRGRFVTAARGREFASEEFRFSLCEGTATLVDLDKDNPEPPDYRPIRVEPVNADLARYTLRIEATLPEPAVSAILHARHLDAMGQPAGYDGKMVMDAQINALGIKTFAKAFLAPYVSCAELSRGSLDVDIEIHGASGKVYRHDPDQASCIALKMVIPTCQLGFAQEFEKCGLASPDRASFWVYGQAGPKGARLVVERGPTDAPVPIAALDLSKGYFERLFVADVQGVPHGTMDVRGRLDVDGEPGYQATGAIAIDRAAPQAEIQVPDQAPLCVQTDATTGRELVRFAVAALDDGPRLTLSYTEYRKGDGPWTGFVPLCFDQSCREAIEFMERPGHTPITLGWDVTGLASGEYTLRASFCDRMGNVGVAERRVTVMRDPPRVDLAALSRDVISPNGDGRADDATATVRVSQSVTFDVEVHQGSAEGPVVRVLATSQARPAGEHAFTWDGRDGAGQALADSRYFLVASGADACGRTGRIAAEVDTDTTAPMAAIASPESGALVTTSVDVLGTAADDHFLSYTLEAGGSTVATGTSPIGSAGAPGTLARWDPPPSTGSYTLRLVATDRAENSSTATVTVNVGPRAYLDRFAATPAVFSPNGDGRRETTTIEYALLLPGRVLLEVRDVQGAILRTLEGGVQRPAGTYALVWDGATDAGTPAPEGEHRVWIHIEDPDGALPSQEQAVGLALDRTPPAVAVVVPEAGAYLSRAAYVHGSVQDARLARFVVVDTPAGGTPVELARGAQGRTDADLAPLVTLADGPHTLSVQAEDAAENRATSDVAFTVDSAPPLSRISTPAAEAVLRKADAPVGVRGMVADENLKEYALSFGSGPAPPYFVEIARSATGGTDILLGSWGVSSLPDGVYTLRLLATDKAGQTTEARSSLTLDGTPPTADVFSPVEGAFLNASPQILGTAADASLESWQLDSAPGTAATAFQWTTLARGSSPVSAGPLFLWSPLPPDGVHTLRLTVRDGAGLSAVALRTVTVDTQPPAAPASLEAVEERNGSAADVRLSWSAGTDSDLAGYRLSRDGHDLTPSPTSATAFTDAGRGEGTYHYSVVAVDRAGNASPPITTTIRVDVTPPVVLITQPQPGAALSGSAEIVGTALSPADFKEYRLFVGAGESPTAWTLLGRSTISVGAGVLGTWLAVGDGPYVLALEAEDLTGNQARLTVPVTVDTQPPLPPVLTAVQPLWNALALQWEASASPDVLGYLVFRNGRIANATGETVGNLRQYLIRFANYEDRFLRDGNHCYRVIAMDQAGNLSSPSNEMCQALDNYAPDATIVQPVSGLKFDSTILVVASSSSGDTDIASIGFEIKPHEQTAWTTLSVATQDPFAVRLDPASLALGDYDLRAVATDLGGRTDATPSSITVTYADLTPPLAARNLVAHADGGDVRLDWVPGTEADLAGYHVFRDGTRLTAGPVLDPAFTDAGRTPGLYRYEVTAVDRAGNQSAPVSTSALVYALRLQAPYPVTEATETTLSGDGAHAGTTIQVLAGDTVLAEVPGSEGAFAVPAVPLSGGVNVLRARGVDGAGNRSIVSDEVVLISDAAPGAVTGLTAAVNDHTVDLGWNAVSDANLAGYMVQFWDDVRTGSSQTSQFLTAEASATAAGSSPWNAVDRNYSTAWLPPSGLRPADWTVTFPAPILVDRVELAFAKASGPAAVSSYRIAARWEGRFVPLVHVRNNALTTVDHQLPSPFQTDAIRVVLESGRDEGLAQVQVWQLHPVPPGTTSFHQEYVSDGSNPYKVWAIDRYGARGPAAEVVAEVGDTTPPAVPTGLAASVDSRTVALSWNPSPEPDARGYVVLRDHVRIADVQSTRYWDADLANGRYEYSLIAVDQVGNESPESAPVAVAINVAPAAPFIQFPTDAAHPIALEATLTDVRGGAEPGSIVSLERNGVLTAATTAAPATSLIERASVPIPSPQVDFSLTPDGSTLAYPWWDSTDQVVKIYVVNMVSGAVQVFSHGASYGAVTPGLSPDGRRLAYVVWEVDHPGHLQVVDVDTHQLLFAETGPDIDYGPLWSPDGSRIAFASFSDVAMLKVRDVANGTTRVLASSADDLGYLSWSPDGSQIAFSAWPSGAQVPELHVVDLPTAIDRVIASPVWDSGSASWSADGSRLAFASAYAPHRIVIRELSSDSAAQVSGTVDALLPRFSPNGRWLSFSDTRWDSQGLPIRELFIQDLETAERLPPGPILWSNAASTRHEWTRDGQIAVSLADRVALYQLAGTFEIKDVALTPGENLLVARSIDPATGLTSPDSDPVRVTVAPATFPDLAVAASDLSTYPQIPVIGQTVVLAARVHNIGAAAATNVLVTLDLVDATGAIVLQQTAQVSRIEPGADALVAAYWTPSAAGTYVLRAQADPGGAIAEAREDNNQASVGVFVAASGDLVATVQADRAAYAARTSAAVSVSLTDAGPPFQGTVRTTVEDTSGHEVAVVDSRSLSLDYGQSASFGGSWNTGVTYAGDYVFRVRATDAAGPRAEASRPFAILPDVSVAAGLVPVHATVQAGAAATFAARIENRGANAPLDGVTWRLRVLPEGSSTPVFEAGAAVPLLPPGGVWESNLSWPVASPAGRYAAELVASRAATTLASVAASFDVTAASASVTGTLTLTPADILAGDGVAANLTVTNRGTAALSAYPFAVEVASGATATILTRETVALDLAAGETREATVHLSTGALAPGSDPVFLRAGATPVTLDRATLAVHGAITPPSVDSPADGATVNTSHPTLCVNDAAAVDGAALRYEFQLFADPALVNALPGASAVPETPARTCWRVQANLTEDATFFWRARASDAFAASAWTAVASAKVDQTNLPPDAPVPDTPAPGATVASREPALAVANAHDAEHDALTYEFRVASEPTMTAVVVSASGVPEGLGTTEWRVPTTLDENATYYWSARASDGRGASPWTAPVSFFVDSTDEAPSAPGPLSPAPDAGVASLTPTLAVANARDPENRPLTYVFEVDQVASFDGPALQVSPAVAEGSGETAWTPPAALADNTEYFWRAAASDGHSMGPWAVSRFFVNLANDPPGVPVPLAPADGEVVASAQPTLRVRNTTDPDRDVLAYDFSVTDGAGTVVASVVGAAEGLAETTWMVPAPLTENGTFAWSSRARDAETAGAWSMPSSFRVNAVQEPPTAPALVEPAEGAVVGTRHPALVAANATSPEGLALTYSFELYGVGADGTLIPVEQAGGIAEGQTTTTWAPAAELPDGDYAWRVRASDALAGPWMATAHFRVAVDQPPAPPRGVRAIPGDTLVSLDWNASPEPDVVGYRIYRGPAAGGPYALAGTAVVPAFDDTGLANGTTVHYVVTAVDAAHESAYSDDVAATPMAGPMAAEVRYSRQRLPVECLLAPPGTTYYRCPAWLYATIELPPGRAPATIDAASIRLGGSVGADPSYRAATDSDGDGVPELQVRFAVERLASILVGGPNTLRLTGRAGGADFRGQSALLVPPLNATLWIGIQDVDRARRGQPLVARLQFWPIVPVVGAPVASIKLNETVAAMRVTPVPPSALVVEFDSAAAVAVMPRFGRFELRVSGTLWGQPFAGKIVIDPSQVR